MPHYKISISNGWRGSDGARLPNSNNVHDISAGRRSRPRRMRGDLPGFSVIPLNAQWTMAPKLPSSPIRSGMMTAICRRRTPIWSLGSSSRAPARACSYTTHAQICVGLE
jgi:hypothetical protein